jgi:hypothetical protein
MSLSESQSECDEAQSEFDESQSECGTPVEVSKDVNVNATDNKDVDDVSNMPSLSSLQNITKSFINQLKQHSVSISAPMDMKLYNFLSSVNAVSSNIFTKDSLNKYLPLEIITNDPTFKNRIDWHVISGRTDLTHDFIRSNIKKLYANILIENYVLSYPEMITLLSNCVMEHCDEAMCKSIVNILKTPDLNSDQKINLINIISKRFKEKFNPSYTSKPTMSEKHMLIILQTYLEHLFDQSSASCMVLLVKFLKLINPIGDLKYSPLLFKYFTKGNCSLLNDFEWNYLIDNRVIEYPSQKTKIPLHVKYIFANKLSEFDGNNVDIDLSLNYHTIDNVIGYMLSNGVCPDTIWNKYISPHLKPYNTPYWFLKKYKKDLNWFDLFTSIIKNYRNNEITLENMLKWVDDNQDNININPNGKQDPTKIIYPEELLYHFGHKLNIFHYNLLKHILLTQKISVKVLDKLAPVLDKKLWKQISICQYLDPAFIKKYENELDWTDLAYNPTWQLYDHSQFHKLPVFDKKNEMLWLPLDQKVSEIKKILTKVDSNATAFLENNNIIIKSNMISPIKKKIETHSFISSTKIGDTSGWKYSDHIDNETLDYSSISYGYYMTKHKPCIFFGPELVVFNDQVKNAWGTTRNSIQIRCGSYT